MLPPRNGPPPPQPSVPPMTHTHRAHTAGSSGKVSPRWVTLVAWPWSGPLWAAVCYLGPPQATQTEALEVVSEPTPTASRKTVPLRFRDSHTLRRLHTTRPHVALSSVSGQVSRTGVCDQKLGAGSQFRFYWACRQ